MSLETNKQNGAKSIARSDLEFLESVGEGGFQHFENVNELRLEDPTESHFDSDLMTNYKLGLAAGAYRQTNGNNNGVSSINGNNNPNTSSHNLAADSPTNKYGNFFLQQQQQQQQLQQQQSNAINDINYMNAFQLQQQQQNPYGVNDLQNNKNYSLLAQNGSNKLQQSAQNYNAQQLNSFTAYLQQQQQQLSSQDKQQSLQRIGSSTNLQKSKSTISAAEVEQQKQQKLINALKSNPQDLESILEEQEKQQLQQQQLQKKLKIESDSKSMPIPKNSSQIELTNYSPTRETIKRVESNTSLNGGNGGSGALPNNTNGERNPSQKNLSKIKGNVKNAYIKKISSLLNLQNQPQHEPQQENYQEPRRADNSDDSDESRSKSDDPLKQEDGKKVMKNRESARNSRHRKKIYIELLEKKISTLQTQIEKQCEDIEKNQKDICKILDNHNHIKAFVQTRHDYIQKIGEMANAEKPNIEQLGYILDSLRLRIGAQGTCRQKAISLYFRTIMKQFMQSTAPYLIYGYVQNLSEDQEFNRCVEIFKKICGIQDEQQAFQFLPHLKKFLESRQNFKECYNRMKKIRKTAFKREESIEKLLDGLSLLHPTQMGKFLKTLDRFRKFREIRLQGKPTNENAATENYEIDQTLFRKSYQPQQSLQQQIQPHQIVQQHHQHQLQQQQLHQQQQPQIQQQQQSHLHQQHLHNYQQQQQQHQQQEKTQNSKQTRQFNSYTNGHQSLANSNNNNNGSTTNNSTLNLGNSNINNNNTNSLNPIANPFVQLSYPSMINATSLGIDGLGDENPLQSQLDMHSFSKPIGFPQSYYYPSPIPMAQQQLLNAHKESSQQSQQQSQQQQQQQQAQQQSQQAQQPYHKQAFNPAASAALQSLKPQQADIDSYYHSQPYKKQFYNDQTNGNLPF